MHCAVNSADPSVLVYCFAHFIHASIVGLKRTWYGISYNHHKVARAEGGGGSSGQLFTHTLLQFVILDLSEPFAQSKPFVDEKKKKKSQRRAFY